MQVESSHALALPPSCWVSTGPARYDYVYEIEVRLLAEVMLLYHSPTRAGRARGPVDALAHLGRSLRRRLSFLRDSRIAVGQSQRLALAQLQTSPASSLESSGNTAHTRSGRGLSMTLVSRQCLKGENEVVRSFSV